MFRKRPSAYGGDCLAADQFIPFDAFVFSAEEWSTETRPGWSTLTKRQIQELSPQDRYAFLEYSYDIDFDRSVGTFDADLATHGSNLINHRCDPNLGFDGAGNVRALRDIQAGEELTMDYGTFVVNTDQTFVCDCGSSNCRGAILRDDWMMLCRYGKHRFPGFIQRKVDELNGLQDKNPR